MLFKDRDIIILNMVKIKFDKMNKKNLFVLCIWSEIFKFGFLLKYCLLRLFLSGFDCLFIRNCVVFFDMVMVIWNIYSVIYNMFILLNIVFNYNMVMIIKNDIY